jgi:thymidylate synthase
MKNYHNLLQEILDNGIQQSNRTGIDTLTLPGAMLKFDLRDGFPAITTKKLAFNQVKGELIGFLRGYTNAADFRALGCTVWDQNANEHGVDMQGNHVENKWLSNPARKGHDDLGQIYSAQWRRFGHTWSDPEGLHGHAGLTMASVKVDQIAAALHEVRYNPTSRRILVSAWNPTQMNEAALPPCHVLFQLLPHVDSRVLHMTMYQRSCDMFLGVPFNIASYALLLELFAAWTGYTAGTLTMFLADAHIYVNHIDQVKEQLAREEYPLPGLYILNPLQGFKDVKTAPLEALVSGMHPDDIQLTNYQHHPAIKAPMAV